jgi:hypothetical protein
MTPARPAWLAPGFMRVCVKCKCFRALEGGHIVAQKFTCAACAKARARAGTQAALQFDQTQRKTP